MNQYLQKVAVGLAGKLIDFGVARITSPHKTTPQERIEQIDKTLETLGSAPEVGQHPTSPPIAAPVAQNKAPPEQMTTPTITQDPKSGGVSPEQLIDYQKREIGKLLLRMESHYAQRLRIKGIPCDCGASKHLLDLESLSEETIPIVDNPQVYYSVLEWIKKVGPKSTEEAAKSGTYDQEYPRFSHEARDFRKEIIGSLDPNTLFPLKPGEPQISLDEAKKLAADEAAKEVERIWSQEKKSAT